jgi:hypothetical protein
VSIFLTLHKCLWFSPGSPASSTTKTGRHDIAEILMKVALNTKNQIKSNYNRVSSNLQRRNKSVKGASEISYFNQDMFHDDSITMTSA